MSQKQCIKINVEHWVHMLEKEERCTINNLSFYIKKLDKEEHIKFKVSRRKIIKSRAKITENKN